MNTYKHLFAAVIIIFITSICQLVSAAEFSADYIENDNGTIIKSTILVKEDKMRIENADGSIMILQNNVDYLLNPEDNTCFEIAYGEDSTPDNMLTLEQLKKELVEVAAVKELGTETINGYQSQKYEIVFHDKSLGTGIHWYTKEIDIPIKTVSKSSFGEYITEYQNIKEENISDSLFEVPADYEILAMPESEEDLFAEFDNLEEELEPADEPLEELYEMDVIEEEEPGTET